MPNQLPSRQSFSQDRAKELRSDLTPAEQLLWSILRAKRLAALKFRRQVNIGPYIADFYCHEQSLVVEVDGDTHDLRMDYDADRSNYLESLGLHVIRFKNDDVLSNLENVGIAILRVVGINPLPWLNGAFRKPPLPNPLPRSGGEETGKSEPLM